MSTLASAVGVALKQKNWMLSTAESCTGGLVGQLVTDISGSSAWYDRGFITYSNESKQQMLGVSLDTIMQFGAVSQETVREMVQGALLHSHADIALAISGIAGPNGGTVEKPVGTVWFAWGTKQGMLHSEKHLLQGDRAVVRAQAAEIALAGILKLTSSNINY